MTKCAVVLFSPGFEEIETVTVIDVLRRAGIEVVAAATVTGPVEGAHGILMHSDCTVKEIDAEQFDAVILPGGMQNARTLAADKECQRVIRGAKAQNRVLAAICAAPIALESAGVIGEGILTSHPVVEAELPRNQYREDRVVRDGSLITSRGPGTALEFALAIVAHLVDEATANKIGEAMLVSVPAAS